jgi:hypothetical protein
MMLTGHPATYFLAWFLLQSILQVWPEVRDKQLHFLAIISRMPSFSFNNSCFLAAHPLVILFHFPSWNFSPSWELPLSPSSLPEGHGLIPAHCRDD